MDNTIVESIKDKIERVFSERNYKNIKVNLESGSKDGDGYVALLVRAVVLGEKNGMNKVIDTMVKCAPKKQKIRKFMSTTVFFNREILYYSTIAPAYKRIQDEFKLSEEMRCEFAKCFESSNKHCDEFLIMENLKNKEYHMMEGNIVLNYEHAQVSMKLLGKLHALSYIFETLNENEFRNLTPQLNDVFFVSTSEYDASGLCSLNEKSLNKYLNCIENNQHKEKVRNAIGSSVVAKLQSTLKSGRKKVINHGDFWVNNIMFKYQDNKPIRAIPLDFQNCRYSSLANDFFQMMALSSEGELRRKYFWKLADDYYNSLAEFLSSCGYNVDSFCTYQEFQQEIRDQALYGLVLNIVILPFFTAKVVWEVHEVCAGNIPEEFFSTSEVYKTRANDMVADWISFGFLE